MFYAAALAMEDLFYSVQGLYNDNILSKLNFDQVKSLYSDNESDFKLFVQKLFMEQSFPYDYPSNLIIYILNQENRPFALSEKELRDIQLLYFTQYASKTKEVNIRFWLLYSRCLYKINKKDDSMLSIYNEARKINREAAERLPESYIKMCIARKEDMYSLRKKHITEVWGDYQSFEAYINSLDESNVKGLTEFIEFSNQCKEGPFSIIHFEFKTLDLQNMPLFERE